MWAITLLGKFTWGTLTDGSQEASELSVTARYWYHLYPPFWDLHIAYILIIYLPPAPRCQALSASTLPKAFSFFNAKTSQ